ncbi:VanZ family protein [Bradyrhizobium sp. NBAIM32]|uniref:VanZ family protein n=1 Tax=Bradyrhizobium sp. NBAIM32 TaxID=2793809 RepID=UPI001CD2743A|nr:VanZ family protein [Bradyrhizobium sp. NBAIM32]
MADMVKFLLAAGWLALALVIFVTLAPIHDRPMIAPPNVERFAAFFILGLVLVLAYSNRIILITLIVVASAVILEALQLLTLDRHGDLMDVLVKVAGGVCGISVVTLARVGITQAMTKIASRG